MWVFFVLKANMVACLWHLRQNLYGQSGILHIGEKKKRTVFKLPSFNKDLSINETCNIVNDTGESYCDEDIKKNYNHNKFDDSENIFGELFH